MIDGWTTRLWLLRRQERAYLLPVLGSRAQGHPASARKSAGLPTPRVLGEHGAADGNVVLAPDAGAGSATSAGGVLVAPLTRSAHATSGAPPARSTRPTGSRLHFFFLRAGQCSHHHQSGVGHQSQRHVAIP